MGILYMTYEVDLERTADAVIDIWNTTCGFVRENRNPSYRILRNKYGIQ